MILLQVSPDVLQILPETPESPVPVPTKGIRMRIALGVEYDGSKFSGWQSQTDSVRTVQSTLERALSQVASRKVAVVCAGRTDAGVHATQQVVHFDCEARRPDKAWVLGTNSNLPSDVAVRWVRRVSDEFHARFDARARTYRYLIKVGPARPALDRHRVAWQRQPLDVALMDTAAQQLIGRHDFSSFRASQCQAKSAVRQVERISARCSDSRIVIDVEANAFLHHMVRIIVGSLLPIGRGEKPVGWLAEILESRDRRVAGKTADAQGLYLTAVRYDERLCLPCSTADPVQR